MKPGRRRLLWALLLLVPLLALYRLSRIDLGWLHRGMPDASLPPHGGAVATADAEPSHPVPTPQVQEAVSASGTRFRIRRASAVQTPEPPYGPAYARLLPAAEGGDADAQYALGLLLYQCRDVPAEREALNALVEQVHQTHARGQWRVADPQVEAAELRRRHRDCDGVPGAARDAYRDWIRRAADNLQVDAMLRMPYALPQAEYCQYLWQCSPEQREFQARLQQEALHYVDMARERGSAEALWSFGAWYLNGEVLEPDDVEAYAHFLALDEIHAAAGRDQRFAAMLDSLERRLRPIDVERGRARADALLANPSCCTVRD